MANQSEGIKVKILSEDGILFEGFCGGMLVPSVRDKVAILPYHSPLIMLLGEGDIQIMNDGAFKDIAKAKKGILYVGDNEATALINA